MHAIGNVDELNALLGVLLAEHPLHETLRTQLMRIQNLLFVVGADLACPIKEQPAFAKASAGKRITENHVGTLERWIDEWEERLPPLQTFILPGGSKPGALLHVARTVCRRAERWIVAFKKEERVNPQLLIFLNRLGDYLFLLARTINRTEGVEERAVRYE